MPFQIFVSIVFFVYGTVIGSFLNVVICRIPKKESIVKGRSHCVSCGHTLSWIDLFPILSHLFLRGKCRYCGAKVSWRYSFVETLCGLSYAAAFIFLGLSIKLIFAIILFPILICLSFYDIDTEEIEYWCPIGIALLGLAALTLSILNITPTPWYEHLIGAVVVSVPFAIMSLFGAMGGADIQLMAAAGLLMGWSIVPSALIGIAMGSSWGIALKIVRKPEKRRVYEDDEFSMKGTVIKFGPFLAAGIAIGFLFGDVAIYWYLSLING